MILSVHTKGWISNRPSYWKPKNTVLAERLQKFWTNVSQNHGFIKIIIPTKSESSCSQNSKYTVFLRKINDPKINGLLLKIYGHYRKIYGHFQKYTVLPKLPCVIKITQNIRPLGRKIYGPSKIAMSHKNDLKYTAFRT